MHESAQERWYTIIRSAVLATISLCLHSVIFWTNSANPLGYDTGFYRRYLTQPFLSFPNTPVPGLGSDALIPRIIFDTLRITHLSPDAILYGSYLVLFSLLPVLLFFLLKPHLGSRGAFFAALFVVLSPIQYNAFWYMFWKNAWALCVLAAAFICIDRRWLVALYALDVTLALSHKTTAIIYIATLGVLFLIDRSRRKQAFLHALVTALGLAAVSFHVLESAVRVPPEAVFIDWPSYLGLSIPFFILILCNPESLRKVRVPLVVVAFTIAAFFFPIFHIPFYQRIFVFCDIALVMFAGAAFDDSLAHLDLENSFYRTAFFIVSTCVALGLLAGTLLDQIRALDPLLSPPAISSIELISNQVPPSATILTTSDEAPWYEGWTLAHIAAPGMLHDDHNLDQWITFWTSTSTPDRIEFLSDFSPPLYISTLGDISDLLGSSEIPCLTELSPNLYRDDCMQSKYK